MFLFDTPAERESIDEINRENILEEIKERSIFQKQLLAYLKETKLFGPILEKAIEDVDFVLESIKRIS